MNEALTVVGPKLPAPLVFTTAGAVKVTAYGLMPGDCISFRSVEETAEQARFRSAACSVSMPSDNEIALAVDYLVGDCKPTLHAGRNTIYINRPGKYLTVVDGLASDGGLLVKVEPVWERDFSAMELGIAPCGCPCVPTTWTWTGGERVNGERVEREYRSNCDTTEWRDDRALEWVETGKTRCVNHVEEAQEQSEFGKLRWTATGKSCGYSPSVPISDGCEVGYMFHPDEERDPAASVAVSDCDGRVLGYVYPTAATGRTVEVGHCAGVIVGYAVNRSETAFDVKCKEC